MGKLGSGPPVLIRREGQESKAFLLKEPTDFTWPEAIRLLVGGKEKQTEETNKSLISQYTCQGFIYIYQGNIKKSCR